jgi:hypothetical protein
VFQYVDEDAVITPVPRYLLTAPTPLAGKGSGNYIKAFTVNFAPIPVGTTIYYTTDGTLPHYETAGTEVFANGTRYVDPITIDKDTTLMWVAYKDGQNASNLGYAEYTVGAKTTVNLGGGSGPVTVDIGTPISQLPIPIKKDCTFAGWYDAPSGGNQLSGSTPITAGMKIYAQWYANNVLKSLKVSRGRLNKSFDPATTAYKLTLSKKQASSKISVAKAFKGAKISIKVGKGKYKAVSAKTIKLAPGKKITIQIKVAVTGMKAKVYKVTVIRKK